ncbi:MAG: hypothetical protein ABIF71_02630 [Planctomycetota bacterium]
MSEHEISAAEASALTAQHRAIIDNRIADWIKAVRLLSLEYMQGQVSRNKRGAFHFLHGSSACENHRPFGMETENT